MRSPLRSAFAALGLLVTAAAPSTAPACDEGALWRAMPGYGNPKLLELAVHTSISLSERAYELLMERELKESELGYLRYSWESAGPGQRGRLIEIAARAPGSDATLFLVGTLDQPLWHRRAFDAIRERELDDRHVSALYYAYFKNYDCAHLGGGGQVCWSTPDSEGSRAWTRAEVIRLIARSGKATRLEMLKTFRSFELSSELRRELEAAIRQVRGR
jgi:hypothetical protein